MIEDQPVVWLEWRRCRVCQAYTGMACTARSGRVVDGRPDGAVTELAQPHTARRRRVVLVRPKPIM